jgi:hypothetical protein
MVQRLEVNIHLSYCFGVCHRWILRVLSVSGAGMPIVGNHEYYSGEELKRYLDSTWEKWEGTIPDNNATDGVSSLGMLLSVGNHHGAGEDNSGGGFECGRCGGTRVGVS